MTKLWTDSASEVNNNNLLCQTGDEGKGGEEKEREQVSPAGHRCNSASRYCCSPPSRLLKRLTTRSLLGLVLQPGRQLMLVATVVKRREMREQWLTGRLASSHV